MCRLDAANASLLKCQEKLAAAEQEMGQLRGRLNVRWERPGALGVLGGGSAVRDAVLLKVFRWLAALAAN